MRQSQEIKIATAVGTIVIILSSYLISSESIYEKVNPTIDDSSKVANIESEMVTEAKCDGNSHDLETVEAVEDTDPIAPIQIASLEQEAITYEKLLNQADNEKPKTNTIAEKATSDVDKHSPPTNNLDEVDATIKQMRYLSLEQNGTLTEASKRFLDSLLPKINDVSDATLLIEGYSDGRALLFSPQTRSEFFAKEALAYIRTKVKGVKLKTVGLGDAYPIIGDVEDFRNNRVELKFTRR